MTRIFGNDAATLERAKDPLALAQLCEVNGIRHPPIAFATPDEPEGWLIKRRGGAGGAHVTAATRGEPAPEDCYYQRRVTGQNVSALFTADGENAGIIGLSVQWSAPTQTSPFRYGGAAGPVEVGAEETEEIARAVACVTSELGACWPQQRGFSRFRRCGVAHRSQPAARRDSGCVRTQRLFVVYASSRSLRGPADVGSIGLCLQGCRSRICSFRHRTRPRIGIGRIGRRTDRRREHTSPPMIPCAPHLPPDQRSISRDFAPTNGREGLSLPFRTRNSERRRDHKRQSSRGRAYRSAASGFHRAEHWLCARIAR